MNKIKSFLQGKKTYILAGLGVIVNGAYAMGYITQQHVEVINYVLVFLGLGTLRAGVNKVI